MLPERHAFGQTADGTPAEAFTLRNASGMAAKLMTFGAALVELHVPDRSGATADVVLGFDAAAPYDSAANQHFGGVIGRVANRISGAAFELDGTRHTLEANEPPNHLHGGSRGFERRHWSAESAQGQVSFFRTSPADEAGYPGRVEARVTYRLTDDALEIDYAAACDAATPLSLTNHSYFNLGGAGSRDVLDHELEVFARRYTPTDDALLPTGEIVAVAGTPLDFSRPTPIGARIALLDTTSARGYDHNYALDNPGSGVAARLRDPISGRVMEVRTTLPGLQLYTANQLRGQRGKGGRVYAARCALCLETQHFPDAVNRTEFPSCILRPGQTWRHTTSYAFSAR